MKVWQMLRALQDLPRDLDVTVDVDDGIQSNYQDVLHVRLMQPSGMEPFVVIDSDFKEGVKR